LPPEGHIEGIGASLPEFELLGYPENKQAYYIRCPKCVDIMTNPKDNYEKVWKKDWLEELERAKKEWEGVPKDEDDQMDMYEGVGNLCVPESVDLIKSETQSTITTDPDTEEDRKDCVGTRSYFLGKREIIVID
jgi:hypothetical protein